MGNTYFYRNVDKDGIGIAWKDLFSESFKKRSRSELDRALNVGTTLANINEDNMLQTWHKPWLWFYAAKWSVAIIAAILLCYYFCRGASLGDGIFFTMALWIPSIAVSVVVLILIWELNIPQNISLLTLFGYLIVGTLCSLIISMILFGILPDGSILAPLAEEPGKFLAVFLLLWYAQNKQGKKIYGATGLVVGAAVGAGFALTESVMYGISTMDLENVFLRCLGALKSHVFYCAPYAAAFSLGLKKHKFGTAPLADGLFWRTFLISCALHASWNYIVSFSGSVPQIFLLSLLYIAVAWGRLFYWTGKCLEQVGKEADVMGTHGTLQICGVSGWMEGRHWNIKGDVVTIGRSEENSICLPGVKGVSRRHCRLQRVKEGWIITDLNSRYGTYLSAERMVSGETRRLVSGSRVALGSKENAFYVVF